MVDWRHLLRLGPPAMQGFISYSHDDYDDFRVLKKHLKQIELGTGVGFWCDERINAGYDWDATILDRIRSSRVFLLLASPNYFAARYVIGRELPAIRSSQRIDDALLIPVVLTECDWQDLLKVPQAVPVGDKRRILPIDKWPKEEGFNAVRDQIKATLAHKFNIKSVSLISGDPVPMSQTEKGMADLRRQLQIMSRVAGSVERDWGINEPELMQQLKTVAGLAERLAESAAAVPTADMLGHLTSLNNVIKQHPLTNIDPDSDEPIGERLRARDGLGNIKLSVDKAIEAVKLAGFKVPPEDDDDPMLRSVMRSKLGAAAIADNVERLDRVDADVARLRDAARQELPPAELPREMADNLADRIEVQAGLAKLELASVEQVDLAAVRRHVEEIERLAASFAKTVAAMRDVLGRNVTAATGALRRSAGAALSAVKQLVTRISSGRTNLPNQMSGQSGPLSPGTRFRDFVSGPEIMVVPPGEFLMGSRAGKGDADERPQHKVTISRPFGVGVTPVTRGEFAAFIRATGFRVELGATVWDGQKWRDDPTKSWSDPGIEQEDDHPVVCVSWEDAQAYVGWLRESGYLGYRLLSESEWEYCCRAGTTTEYCTGDEINAEQANFGGAGGGTTPVLKFRPNQWGLHDLHGNVWEWCADNWHDTYTGAPSDGSVWQGGSNSLRVLRGGSWGSFPEGLRSANRNRVRPVGRNSNLGFRVARTL